MVMTGPQSERGGMIAFAPDAAPPLGNWEDVPALLRRFPLGQRPYGQPPPGHGS
jgi:hypothetical protein